MNDYIFYYLLFINLVSLLVMYIDKNRAVKGKYRIKEKTIWRISIIGGAFGATLGMYLFRHKTKKLLFKFGLPTLTIVYITIIYSLLQKTLS